MAGKYDVDEAAAVLGREVARHGDWAREKRQAAVELFEAVAALNPKNGRFAVTCDPGKAADSRRPPTLHFDFGDAQVEVTYAAGKFGAFSPDGKRQVDFDLEFNGYLLAFESTEEDLEQRGKRRPAAVALIEAVVANLRS